MAARTLAAPLRTLSSPGAAAFALALPLVFLHVRLQPTLSLGVGDTTADVSLSDLAVLVALGAAVWAGRELGFAPLRRGIFVYAAVAAFVAWVCAATLYPLALYDEYDFAAHALTAAKFAEYALLVVATPLALRTREDVAFVLGVLTVWSVAASVVAVLQFFGIVREFRGYRPGEREPSFLGYHDFAALSGAALSIALARVALDGRMQRAAGAAGVVGVVLSGALAGLFGVIGAAFAAAAVALRRGVLTSRRVAGLAAVLLVTTAGVVSLRAANIEAFLKFLGVERADAPAEFAGESYVQRLALGYIGGRIFLDHPVLGVGWQATSEEWTYGPYLEDARARFPDVAERSLPSPEHPWGVQNAYVQAAAELGIPGLLLFLALFAAPIFVAFRAASRAPPATAAVAALPILWLVVSMGVWLGLGIVAGIPLVALTFLGCGLAVTAAGWVDERG